MRRRDQIEANEHEKCLHFVCVNLLLEMKQPETG
jgi:hypothetical protein